MIHPLLSLLRLMNPHSTMAICQDGPHCWTSAGQVGWPQSSVNCVCTYVFLWSVSVARLNWLCCCCWRTGDLAVVNRSRSLSLYQTTSRSCKRPIAIFCCYALTLSMAAVLEWKGMECWCLSVLSVTHIHYGFHAGAFACITVSRKIKNSFTSQRTECATLAVG